MTDKWLSEDERQILERYEHEAQCGNIPLNYRVTFERLAAERKAHERIALSESRLVQCEIELRNQIAALQADLAAERQKAASLPANWNEDSSLETWFPLTAEELKRVKQELGELKTELAAERQKVAELVEALSTIRIVARNTDQNGWTRDSHDIFGVVDEALAKNGGKP